jgi:sarcosine oxidase
MKVTIVGAGVLGAALARTLVHRGLGVTLIEQHGPEDPRRASHACSRILRLAHGAEARETRSAWLSRRLWLELERETGRSLFSEVGMAWLASSGDATWEGGGRSVLADEGIEVALLSPSAAAGLLPGLRTDDLEQVLYEPQAGLLRATEAVRALVEDAVASGAELLRGRAAPDGAAVLVGGRRLESDRVVWACGAWTPRLFPELVRGKVIQQDVSYFAVGEEWASPPAPAWGERSRSASGSGDLLGFGFKVGLDTPGPSLDPDAIVRPPVPEHGRDARAFLALRFPGLVNAALLRTETCQSVVLDPAPTEETAMLGGEVRLLRHPEHRDVWLLGDGSGHAFKHAPAIAAETATMLARAEKEIA